ncbi:TetR/AcrR family transcriptional regulator [Actinacidiphila acididurans]|uniref:TetR/AcrR family transcriptional regulator n=1 Tax=Actinacidiphila acididurans TaxID=2784346 RepID=A0ABS2TME3_9ACTN|nr:TetR/AcrR family transcriptional regulator [Actinacidiphila acididurans]MBM9504166.1 TetR/AcrR family transcriptional regulator [Actinacidiphila acididurans]
MNTRAMILGAASRLLAESSTGDVSTRAVCDAAGVAQPTLYRLFGDKDGLLAAVVDAGFERYLASKRALAPTGDPAADLRDGWDNHVAFALSSPHLYRLMFVPGLGTEPAAVKEMHTLLRRTVDRCATAGLLRVPAGAATQIVMSANTGLALSLVTHPGLFPELSLSALVRDIVLAGVLTGADPAPVHSGADEATAIAAITLAAILRTAPPAALTDGETGLLLEWADRLAATHLAAPAVGATGVRRTQLSPSTSTSHSLSQGDNLS